MNEWIINVIYIHKGVLFSHKKNEILPFVTIQMNIEGIINEVSQMEKDKYYMISLICGI